MLRKKSFVSLFIIGSVIVLALGACNPVPATPPAPTVDNAQVAATLAMQIVGTSFAAMTQTALANPTATPTPNPTATPAPTNTPAPTQVVATNTPVYVYVPAKTAVTNVTAGPSITPTQGDYQCTLTRMDPVFGAKIKQNDAFDLHVTMKNIGNKTWTASDFDFRFISGTQFQDSVSSIDVPNDVQPGESVTFVVDMTAKTGLGVQNASWALAWGGQIVCPVYVNIQVVE